ncbi:spore protease YyaC [Metabacillus sp. Hm71]|uniref:spore protease YyaC n=1 Tax=Metabacillus sp. Hm71 TaxID=3450743 RepID=UPI003F42449C
MLNNHEMNRKRAMLEGIIPYNHKLAPLFIRNTLYSLIPEGTEHIYVVGIGSNLINGDSLGPFVGTLLQDLYPEHLSIIGNLQSPLDATTLVPKVSQVTFSENSFVIAIDSVLGSEGIVHSIVVRGGSLQPGKGLGRKLPSIGNCSIMGVILENDSGLEASLFYTSLHLIYKMAMNIAKGISLAIRQFFHYPSDHPLLLIS